MSVMRHFKRPLKITGILLLVGLLLSVGLITMIHQSDASRREKEKRAEQLGSGVATLMCIIAAPFWFAAAIRVRREREEKAVEH